ncbi:unnamed protein product, partial [Closterium sp. NIES-53]
AGSVTGGAVAAVPVCLRPASPPQAGGAEGDAGSSGATVIVCASAAGGGADERDEPHQPAFQGAAVSEGLTMLCC